MSELESNAAGVAVHDLILYRGDTFSFAIEVLQDGMPLDLATYEVNAFCKPNGKDGFALLCRAQGNVIDVSFSHEHTRLATWKAAKYDVQIRKGDVVKTVLCGKVDLIGDVTP